YPCAENLNKSFYFYPENQCSNSTGGYQKDIEASEFVPCNSNSDDCLNIESDPNYLVYVVCKSFAIQ
ncbi:hypothetical protein A2U01_0039387, partial [Trifolium medium]|nr:hypothetical protein [Trifolium medium]